MLESNAVSIALPGPKGLPVVGVGLQLSPQWLIKTQQKYGDTFALNIPIGGGGIFFAHPDAVHAILTKDQYFDKIRLGNKPQSFLTRMMGNGLFGAVGDEWTQQRKLMQPVFHRQRIVGFFEMMVERIESAFSVLDPLIRDHATIDIHQVMNHITMDVIAHVILSSSISEAERPQVHQAIRDAITSFRPGLDPHPSPIIRRRFNRAMQLIDTLMYRVIGERQAMPAEARPNDLLTMLLETQDEETGRQMDTKQLRDEVFTLFLAGHETTAATITWALYVLAQRPDIMEKLHNEAAHVLAGNPLQVEHLPQLTYNHSVIDETLRLYSISWLALRRAVQDTELAGILIPQKKTVFISSFVTHRHPDFWQNPEVFDPTRFVNGKPAYPNAYLPFGGGKRICLGNYFALMEAQLLLTIFNQRYRLELLDKNFVGFRSGLALAPKNKPLAKIYRHNG